MKATIDGAPSFAHIQIELDPGEEVVAESDAMASMDADLDMTARLNGGFFAALLKRFLGGESLFINTFANRTQAPKRLTLVQPTPGNIATFQLNGDSRCLQPGAYVASTPGIQLGLRWAGFTSWIAREGLFKLQVSGTGTVWYGAYGGLLEKEVNGEYLVDTGYLVAYEPQLKLSLRFAGGIFSSLFGGEGLVTRISGKGKITLQTRSLEGMRDWLNPRI
ncbi:MAG: TIGR00266 family protein [Myxococcales bacterium]|nr:TIGR00266 family protein [Myxococcales bacterium]